VIRRRAVYVLGYNTGVCRNRTLMHELVDQLLLMLDRSCVVVTDFGGESMRYRVP
jgi:hypothetical protein